MTAAMFAQNQPLFKAPTFSPTSSFTGTERGIIVDASNLGSLWADTAATTPASVDGQVARIDDIAGFGHQLNQATSTKRPLLKQSGSLYYLQYDDIDDVSVSSATIDLSATDEVTVVAALEKGSDATVGLAVSFGNANTTAGAFDLATPLSVGSNVAFRSRGATATVTAANLAIAAPAAKVLAGLRKIGEPSVRLFVDLEESPQVNTAQGANANGNLTLAIGARDSGSVNPAALKLYYLMIINRILTPAELTQHIRYAATKMGRTL